MKKIYLSALAMMSLAFGGVANAQVAGQSFYIDFGQNNVANQGQLSGTDANGHVWNNLHGKGTGAPDKAYAMTTINLQNSEGTATSYKLQIGTTFSTNGYSNGGLNNPDPALLGDMAVQTATQDYIFLEGGQDYGIIRFKGLDPQKGYRFYSFGSRTDTGTPGRVATFHFRGLNSWQGDHAMGAKALGANGYNGNNNNVQESDIIFPDADGVIEMTLIKKTKNGMVHLNAMKMVEYTGVSHPRQQYTLNKKMYFDFGENGKAGNRGDITQSPDGNGNYWNNLSCETSGNAVAVDKKVSVVASDNTATGITLTNMAQFNANGYNNGGLKEPNAEYLGDLAVAGATQDYIYTESGKAAVMFFSGLDKSKMYRFHIFGTRTDNSAQRSAILRLDGMNNWMFVQTTSGPNTGGEGVNQNVGNICVSDFIQPDEVGNIVFTYRQNTAPACSFGHVSAVKIEEWNTNGVAEVVPTPAGDQKFYIDFGEYNVSDRGNITEGADANGNYWTNVYSSPIEKLYPRSFTLKNSNNELTPYTITVGTYFHTNGMSGGGGLLEPNAALLGDLAVATATQDYIHMEGTQEHSVIHFRGLNPDKAYKFYSFGHRNADDARAGYFTFSGENSWTGEMQMTGAGIGDGGYNGNNNKILESEPIFPDKDGNITLTMKKKYSGGMVYLNCMKVEEISGLTRPNGELTLKQKMFLDFGETANNSRGHQTTGADKNGNYWNNITSGSSGSNKIAANKEFALVNSANTATGAKYVSEKDQYTNGINAGGNNNPDATVLGELGIQTATEDYMFIDNSDERPFKFTGLNKNSCYRFYIYGNRTHTDNRVTKYTIEGQQTWEGGQSTSGFNIGGYGVNGNLYNVLVSDLVYPDRNGVINVKFQRIAGMAHVNAIKIEEYQGGTRPEDPLTYSTISLTGNAEDVAFHAVPGKSNLYEAYAHLTPGTFNITANTIEAGDVTVEESHAVASDMVARITFDATAETVTVLPVTLNVRGNIAAGNPAIAYKGNGVWEGEVTLKETTDQQWVNKTMYFAFNNSDVMAIKRLKGAATRFNLGESEYGQDIENIYQNAGTYTITVDMNSKEYSINAPVDENRISVFGSSVANGQGATDYKGYRYLYGQHMIDRFESGESENPFYTSNVSIGGNKTTDLLGRYDDLTRDFGRYVIFGLSLGNEGIHGAANQQAIFNQWRDNMQTLIAKVRADGKIPVVMNNYTRSDYNDSDYGYVKQLNMLIHEWDVPSFNCLGAIDNGHGQWADGYVSDTYHQNTAGHYEFFYSMVPSLFDALKANKPLPVRNQTKSMTLAEGKQLVFAPEGTVHPFTISARVKKGEGNLFTITDNNGNATVKVNADGTVTFTTAAGSTITSTEAITDNEWHNVTLTSYYAAKRTILYVDKTKAGELAQRMGDVTRVAVGDASANREISELSFWRSGMTPEEINAVCDGRMLKSSLEIYAPLGGADDMANLAQSTNALRYEVAPVGKLVKSLNTDVQFVAESGNGGFSANENFPSLFDGTTNKWCLNVGSGVHVIFHATQPVSISGYKITTGADCAQWTGRNPQSWKLYGSTAAAGINENDASWELIDEVTNDDVLKDVNSTTYTFNLPSATAKAYTTFKWVITARDGGGTGVLQVEEFCPIVASSLPSKAVRIAVDEGTAGWGDEVANLFDDNNSSNWKVWAPAYAIFHASKPIRINGYELVTGNDNEAYHDRNPKNWVLYGSTSETNPGRNNDVAWEPIYTVKDDAVLEDINTKTYQFEGAPTRKEYRYFKLEVSETKGSLLQLGELNVYAYEHSTIGNTDVAVIGAPGFATYVTPFATDFTLTDNITAYKVVDVPGYVKIEPVEKVAANTAVVLEGAAGRYNIHSTSATVEDTSDNLLLVANENILVNDAFTYYVLANQSNGVGFYPVKVSTCIPYLKGYLYIPAGAKTFFPFGGEETAIESIEVIPADAAIYNVAGQKLQKLQKGVNIINGKKVMVK